LIQITLDIREDQIKFSDKMNSHAPNENKKQVQKIQSKLNKKEVQKKIDIDDNLISELRNLIIKQKKSFIGNKYREDIVELMLKNNVYLNPTLGPGLMRVETMENKKKAGVFTDIDQEESDKVSIEHEHRLECFNRMHKAGVPMSAGSDSAWGAYEMGNYFLDIEGHVMGGQSPVEAIMSATSIASQSCWIENSLGSIESGKLADLIVLDESPVNQIENLRTVSQVIKDGKFIDRENLL
jgi:imidazolonepropionase-like amidohydrolase